MFHYVWKNIINYLTPKFIKKSFKVRKQSVTSCQHTSSKTLFYVRKNSIFSCAEIISIDIPWNDKFSSFIFVKMSARYANLWIQTVSHRCSENWKVWSTLNTKFLSELWIHQLKLCIMTTIKPPSAAVVLFCYKAHWIFLNSMFHNLV
jgi:hypothetical protein